MLAPRYPLYLGNHAVYANEDLAVIDKYSGELATRVALATPSLIDSAIELCVEAEGPMRRLPSYTRREVLTHCVRRFTERAERLALALCIEAGKPLRDARGEVTRLIETFRIASEEATRLYRAHKAWDELAVGGVIIGDVPSFRVDNMPYGGVKQSGLGREGVRSAIEHMTEVRMLVIRTSDAR